MKRIKHVDTNPSNNPLRNLGHHLMSKKGLMEPFSKEDLMKMISKQELMNAYDKLNGRLQNDKSLKENGFVLVCPHCQNDSIEDMLLIDGMIYSRTITKIENGTIFYGDIEEIDWTAKQHLECGKCHQDFAIPTNAKREHSE